MRSASTFLIYSTVKLPCCFIKSLPLNFYSVNNILFIIIFSDLQKDFFLAFSFQNLYNPIFDS